MSNTKPVPIFNNYESCLANNINLTYMYRIAIANNDIIAMRKCYNPEYHANFKEFGIEILAYLAATDNLDFFKKIIQSWSLDLIFVRNITFRIACANNSCNVAEYLITKGTNASASNNVAIVYAAVFSENRMLNMLLNAGANIDARDNYPFLTAICYKNIIAIKFFIENKIDVNMPKGQPLKNAIRLGNLDTVQLLLDAGADVKILREKHFMYLFKNKMFDMVKLLINHGADLSVLNKSDNIDAGNAEFFRLLVSSGLDLCTIIKLLL